MLGSNPSADSEAGMVGRWITTSRPDFAPVV